MTRIDRTILRGDRVRHAPDFLASTGQFTEHDRGPEPPCHWGYHARGKVLYRPKGSGFVRVRWDDGYEHNHHVRHLARVAEPGT